MLQERKVKTGRNVEMVSINKTKNRHKSNAALASAFFWSGTKNFVGQIKGYFMI